MPLHIIILAAGKGTRMYSQQPKVLHKIGAKSMLEHVIDTAKKLNPKTINVIIGHRKEQILQQLANHSDINWIEQTEQLGTGHAVKTALPYLPEQGKTLILFGDVPLIDVATLTQLLDRADDQMGLLTDVVEKPAGYGRIIRHNNNVVAIVEEKDATAEQKNIHEINTGIMVVPNRYLTKWLNALEPNNAQGEYYLTDIIELANQDKVAIHPLAVRASYLASGVNNKTQLAYLERVWQEQQATNLLQQGVTLLDPQRFDLRGSLKVGKDVVIDVNCVFEGDNIVGDNVVIGANSVIKNATIGSYTQIAPFSHLEDCVVGNNVKIGPFARLRPQTVLQDEVHIGNFVEVKKSQIGQGSKINHLTYIGDATIGQQSNIGAGTITANYDGVHKYQTTIGDYVRIGSNNVLVAPIKIGDYATTGAGSTLTKNCPENKLTLSRARQTTLDNWVRPEKIVDTIKK